MDIRKTLFKYRSYTPIPFLVLMIIYAKPTISSILIGLVLVILGEFLRLWGVSIAGSETRTTKEVGGSNLITSGPFAYVRNPLYLGNIIIYLGVGIMSLAAFPTLTLITLLYFIFQYYMIVSLEEEHLLNVYGDEYKQYKYYVPKFLPNFKKYRLTKANQPQLDWIKGLKSERRTLQAIIIIVLTILIIWFLQNQAQIKLFSEIFGLR
ncbi:MAG: putative protein-S-isoprenylcysteine methyltransferase [Ignavibacteriae bacterium]|nr:MAG: putative protein-S-isoprenylcysteine methyltransferase [Ignavibacteriota bacterium]